MNISVEDISRMSIECQKSYYLIYGMKLVPGARVLVSWRNDFMLALLQELVENIKIDCLMDVDFATFVQEKCSDKIMIYDYILDNGLLVQTNMDVMLVRAMGMHLAVNGRLRSFLPIGMEGHKMVQVALDNNFGDGRLLSVIEKGADSFYIAEFSLFNQGVTWLQSFYTDDLRRKLVYLLQRLDFGLEVEHTLLAIRQLCCQHNVTDEYLSIMADIATIHKQQVKRLLLLQ